MPKYEEVDLPKGYEEVDLPASFSKKKGEGLTPQQRELRKRYSTTLHEGAVAGEKQDIANAKGEFAGTMAATIPAAVAAPFTGGLSLAPAVAAAGGVGLASGLARETAKAAYGSTQMPHSAKELAYTLGLDTAMGMATELGVRGVTATLGQAPKLLERAAVKTEEGAKLLRDHFTDMNQKLYARIAGRKYGTPLVDVEHELKNVVDKIEHLPRALGQTGQRFGAITDAAADIIKKFKGDLELGGEGVATKQPLDGLIRAHRSFQQAVYHETGLAAEEATFLQRAADSMGKKIRAHLGRDPVALDLYEGAQRIFRTQNEQALGIQLAEKGMDRIGKAMKNTPGLGLLTETAGVAKNALATWALRKTLAHPEAAALMKQAIRLATTGDVKKAEVNAAAAFAKAEVKEQIKSWAREANKIQDPLSQLQSQQPVLQGPQPAQ